MIRTTATTATMGAAAKYASQTHTFHLSRFWKRKRCNFKTDKASYNATTDAGVTITAELFFTAPNQQDNVSLSFGGSQTVVVLDSNLTADPLGNVITKTVPFSSLCNGLNKVTLKATSAQSGQLINADIPVTIANAQSCTQLSVNNPFRSSAASVTERLASGRSTRSTAGVLGIEDPRYTM